jgi:hypothetical protein
MVTHAITCDYQLCLVIKYSDIRIGSSLQEFLGRLDSDREIGGMVDATR